MKLAQKAKLPDRMELDKQRLEYAQAVGTVPYDAHECTFTPQINHDIPDFELRHREFQETLLAAKATKVCNASVSIIWTETCIAGANRP